MAKNTEVSEAQSKFNVGDEVSFKIEKQTFKGFIDKSYTNSFLITFESDDPEIIDKYHKKVVINNRHLKLIKAAPKIKEPDSDKEDKDDKPAKK
ncbi:hypothetical protein [Lentilactobacillus hilgardii]|uniref:DUF2187 domain-containing protein n=1 Tax=Lentilactobacillus hilgardii (strain ATCC 8290 / DSM 20176 / CCUG 30140 / JCM 1155 / KCTC 3500 / NBRC 15886 / NCIMB 8040 / NRRL B-1843 / 9) TaxID=1423757 RepID=C0XHM4_LENH9|nr:hypothetical protein [Lentilactobacillus hilgardii]EEI25156.1 hypothetical protein HMPREF0519_0735 [Lentilactobacillus hilgardii DSM 20176 = ATCC 8290]KRK59348.1 hypothetical protein FD42_GL000068 [Lentilactobacillus hilgardii DSM 20176 = ATCC 8290]QEU39128.1 DUF2187 domain-containing protein [Lentilactobacillus hilgardii]TDG83202.1 hypothetical protein C5L34_000777 [Lentilactobacillus hilgardii]